MELAHEEFIEDTILRMKDILERFFLQNETISLSQLEIEGQINGCRPLLHFCFWRPEARLTFTRNHSILNCISARMSLQNLLRF